MVMTRPLFRRSSFGSVTETRLLLSHWGRSIINWLSDSAFVLLMTNSHLVELSSFNCNSIACGTR